MRHAFSRSWPALVLLGLVGFTVLVIMSGVSLQTLPTIGGVRGPTYRVTADFDNVLNLPERAYVRLNGVDVGSVSKISTTDYHAEVKLDIKTSVKLPGGTTAQLRQASPLGDVFVALSPPAKPTGLADLRDGSRIGVASTSAAPQVEDMLAAASVLVNGGALNDLGTIVKEMNQFLDGNESHLGGVTRSVGDLASVLNRRSSDIDRALAAMRSVTATFRKNLSTVHSALTDFTPAIRLAASEREEIVHLLKTVDQVGVKVQRVAGESGADLVTSLVQVRKVLLGFSAIGDRLAPTLRDMLTLADVADFSTRGENLAGVAYLRVTPQLVLSIVDFLNPLNDKAGGTP